MSRFARLVTALCAMIGFSAGVPEQSHAGVIPWMYDAIFGPPGSLRTAYYQPVSGGSSYSTNYTPMTVAYGPTYSGGGCACNQTSSYAPMMTAGSYYGGGCSSCGTSGCSSCASGNCSSGIGSVPMTSGYGPSGVAPAPAPDPNYNSPMPRDVQIQLKDIQHQLRSIEHHQRETDKFLDTHFEGKYLPSPYVPNSTYNSGSNYNSGTSTYGNGPSETVPPRQRRDTFGSEQKFRKHAPAEDPIEQDVRKPDLSAPPAPEDKTNTKSKAASETKEQKESEPQAFNLDRRMTSQAVAPRERMEIVTKDSKLKAIAKSNKKATQTSEKHSSTELARQ